MNQQHWYIVEPAVGEETQSTYWLNTKAVKNERTESSRGSELSSGTESSNPGSSISHIRLIEWSVQELLKLIKKIIVHRNGKKIIDTRSLENFQLEEGKTFFDEVAEIIVLPPPNEVDIEKADLNDIELDSEVVRELRTLVGKVASMYNDNPFHSFEHANHVTMSIVKLLSRIVKPSDQEDDKFNTSYGITSDPLTQFACAFSGLIHDADHPGVFNSQLSKEKPELSEKFKHKSVAEQNSLELCLELFMSDEFSNLRDVLFTTSDDQERFRQLVVNSVMATDIVDKDLKELRNARWRSAFSERQEEAPETTQNRKATIVIEHLIQASDVAHTMQHWNVYRKWNERLFREIYVAFKAGRSPMDPTLNWAKGEIGFFDFYIIPLAKKLKDCGVFGVSSDEYLNYALQNRRRWELEGQAITAQMIEELHLGKDAVEGLPPEENPE